MGLNVDHCILQTVKCELRARSNIQWMAKQTRLCEKLLQVKCWCRCKHVKKQKREYPYWRMLPSGRDSGSISTCGYWYKNRSTATCSMIWFNKRCLIIYLILLVMVRDDCKCCCLTLLHNKLWFVEDSMKSTSLSLFKNSKWVWDYLKWFWRSVIYVKMSPECFL